MSLLHRFFIKDIPFTFVASFLRIREIGVMDVAICDHDLRSLFLEWLSSSSSSTSTSGTLDERLNSNCLHWLSIRKKSLSIICCDVDVLDHHLIGAVTQSPELKCLKISFNEDITRASLHHVSETCHNLQELHLSHCSNVTGVPFQSLVTLSLQNCNNITDSCLIMMTENCIHLKNLILFHLDKITDNSLISIVVTCRHLSNISIGYCDGITSESLHIIANSHDHILKQFSLEGMNHITNSAITKLSEKCIKLKKFFMGRCNQITEAALLTIPERCSSLELIKLWSDDNIRVISDQFLLLLIEKCLKMKSIILSGESCNLDGIVTIDDIDDMIDGNDDMIPMNISRYHGLSTVTHELLQLSLNYCDNITDQSLIQILTTCPLLSHLDIISCKNVTNHSLCYIGKYNRLLKFLRLNQSNINDDSLIAIAKGCQLEGLDMNSCSNITDHGMKIIAEFGSKIYHLSIFDCESITDISLYHIAEHFSSLKELHILHCKHITNAGVIKVAESCSKLSDLHYNKVHTTNRGRLLSIIGTPSLWNSTYL